MPTDKEILKTLRSISNGAVVFSLYGKKWACGSAAMVALSNSARVGGQFTFGSWIHGVEIHVTPKRAADQAERILGGWHLRWQDMTLAVKRIRKFKHTPASDEGIEQIIRYQTKRKGLIADDSMDARYLDLFPVGTEIRFHHSSFRDPASATSGFPLIAVHDGAVVGFVKPLHFVDVTDFATVEDVAL